MPSLADASAQILSGNRPVLFLDTCILLDIIRATMRRAGTNVIRSAVDLRGLLGASPAGCVVAVASPVPSEWSNYADKTRDEVGRHFDEIQEQALHFHDACAALGIGLNYGLPAYPAANLHGQLFDLSRGILDRAIVLDTDGQILLKAFDRVTAKRPPSREGGEMQDCIILEGCLELTRMLRAAGFGRKCVFCTSNTRDYGRPDPRLASDFQAVNLTLYFPGDANSYEARLSSLSAAA